MSRKITKASDYSVREFLDLLKNTKNINGNDNTHYVQNIWPQNKCNYNCFIVIYVAEKSGNCNFANAVCFFLYKSSSPNPFISQLKCTKNSS